MRKWLFPLTLLLLLSVIPASAQEELSSLRLTPLTYREESEGVFVSTMDIFLDGEIIFEAIPYPFTTDYVEVSPGEHTLTLAITGEAADQGVDFPLSIEAGGRYSLVAEGDFAQEVRFVLVDETDLPMKDTTSAAVVVNLYPEAIDIYGNQTLIVQNLAPGRSVPVALPIATIQVAITRANNPNAVIHQGDYSGIPNTYYLAIANGASPDEFSFITQAASDLPLAEYLAGLKDRGGLTVFAAAAQDVELFSTLADDGYYTLFAPVNDAFAAVTIPADPAAISAILLHHIVEENLPPYLLPNDDQLTALDGGSLSLQFSETETGLWEIEGAPIYSDIRLANGVIYTIGGVLLPAA
jgi:uncharacterized surface protein with fasciclin (FAS1) repeats